MSNEEKELHSQRIKLEEAYDNIKETIDSKLGVYYSENDIIIEARLNNILWEIKQQLNKIYKQLEDYE